MHVSVHHKSQQKLEQPRHHEVQIAVPLILDDIGVQELLLGDISVLLLLLNDIL